MEPPTPTDDDRIADTAGIPAVLHVVWVGGSMPYHLADNVDEWRRLHPSWGMRVWGDDDLDWLTNRRLFDAAPRLVPADAVGQFRSDVARYEIIHRHGGLYVDVDTRPLREVDDTVLCRTSFAVREDRQWTGNTYLGGVAGHPLFAALVAGLPDNVAANRGRRPNVLSGPKYLTPIWRKHRGYTAPTAWGYPYSYSHVRSGGIPSTYGPDTYAVHQWEHTRTTMARRGRSGNGRRRAVVQNRDTGRTDIG